MREYECGVDEWALLKKTIGLFADPSTGAKRFVLPP
jgi:hypothetical protein